MPYERLCRWLGQLSQRWAKRPVGCCPPTVTASGPARRLQSTPRPTKDRCAVHLAFRLAASATKRSRPPSAKRGRCWRTSPLPTGRCGQGRPSKLYAMRLTCAWPGTVPKALAVRRLTASSRHGKPAFPTTPPARRRPPLWSGRMRFRAAARRRRLRTSIAAEL